VACWHVRARKEWAALKQLVLPYVGISLGRQAARVLLSDSFSVLLDIVETLDFLRFITASGYSTVSVSHNAEQIVPPAFTLALPSIF